MFSMSLSTVMLLMVLVSVWVTAVFFSLGQLGIFQRLLHGVQRFIPRFASCQSSLFKVFVVAGLIRAHKLCVAVVLVGQRLLHGQGVQHAGCGAVCNSFHGCVGAYSTGVLQCERRVCFRVPQFRYTATPSATTRVSKVNCLLLFALSYASSV